MAEPQISLVEGKIAALNLGPTDRLVVTVNHLLTQYDLIALRDAIKEWAPGVKCLIVNKDIEFSVVHEEEF